MKLLPAPLISHLRRFAAVPFFLLSAAILSAQSSDAGGVTGRVFDAATGRSLEGAVVTVVGTTANAFTDHEGLFSIPGVPAGSYILEVDYVGLDLFREPVNVSAGAATPVSAGLKSTILQLEAFTVAESARGQALAINTQKAAKGIINIISEEAFGHMEDGNIGHALARLPGLTVEESGDGSPGGANIRGVSDDFNRFQIDGNSAPTSGGGRGFDPNQMAADGISSIEVIKAATPDRDGDAIGGIINVVSRSAFQRDGREIRIGVGGSYLELADMWGADGKISYTDIFSVGGGEKNLGISISVSKYDTPRFYENWDMDYDIWHASTNPTYNLPYENFYAPYHLLSERNVRRTDTQTVSAAIDFRASENSTFYFRPSYSRYERITTKYLTRAYMDERHQDELTGRKVWGVLEENYGRTTTGSSGSRGNYRFQAEEADTWNDLYTFAAGGKHEMNSATLSYDFFYSISEYERYNDSAFVSENHHRPEYIQFEYDITDREKPVVRILNGKDPRDLSGMNEGTVSIEPEAKTHEIYTAKVDWEKKFVTARSSGSFKLGAKHAVSSPKFEQGQFEYDVDDDYPYASVMSPVDSTIHGHQEWMRVDPVKVRDLLKSNPELYELDEFASLEGATEEDYSAEEKTTAAYAMGTLQFGRTTMIGGLRMERNSWNSTTYALSEEAFEEDPATAVSEIRRGKNYTVWLPGLHFRHELRKNLILRESYNRSYGRPPLGDLTQGRVEGIPEEGDLHGDILMGNPELDPTMSDNFDVQLEYYTARGGLYSAAFFYKKMKGFYYDRILSFTDTDDNGIPIPDPDGDLEFEQPHNANGAENYGVELIAQQKLYFLPGPLKGLSVALSATFTESDGKYPSRPDEKLPTPGFAHTMYNTALKYAAGGFRADLSYRYKSDQLESVSETIYQDTSGGERDYVDFEMSYRLRKGVRFYFSGKNLTDTKQVSYTGNPRNIEDWNHPGRRYTFGTEFTF
ncbi:MAG: TonB-dependent receptor [Opitutus sp.]